MAYNGKLEKQSSINVQILFPCCSSECEPIRKFDRYNRNTIVRSHDQQDAISEVMLNAIVWFIMSVSETGKTAIIAMFVLAD